MEEILEQSDLKVRLYVRRSYTHNAAMR